MFCGGRPCQTTFPGLATPDKSVIYLSRHGVGHGVGHSVPEIHGISDIAKPSRDGNPWLVSATIDTCDDWWRILSVHRPERPEWGVTTDVYTCEPDMSETDTRVFHTKTSDMRQPLTVAGCVILTSFEGFGNDVTLTLPAIMTPDKSRFLIHCGVISI